MYEHTCSLRIENKATGQVAANPPWYDILENHQKEYHGQLLSGNSNICIPLITQLTQLLQLRHLARE